MNNKLIVLFLTVILLFTITTQFQIIRANNIIIVPDDYPTIQAAINNAETGMTIYVKAGHYTENITINKSITLLGEDFRTTFIDGNRSDFVIAVYHSDVTIRNFTIMNSSNAYKASVLKIYADSIVIENNYIYSSWAGIYTYNTGNHFIVNNIFDGGSYGIYFIISSSSNITGNVFKEELTGGIVISGSGNYILNNRFYGSGLFTRDRGHIVRNNLVNDKPLVYMEDESDKIVEGNVGQIIIWNSENITIKNANLDNTTYGILASYTKKVYVINSTFRNDYVGIYFSNVSEAYVALNTLKDNVYGGMFLYGVKNTVISNNIITENSRGIFLSISKQNTILNNTFWKNGDGISLTRSRDNRIYHNDFIENHRQAYCDEQPNYWDNGYPDGGNYWSDYTGSDAYSGANQSIEGGDGIGDTPYIINDYNIDQYPLMEHLFEIPDIILNGVALIGLIIAVVILIYRRRL